MYGMVMMAALTTGMDMPDFGRRGGGGCCGGCYGGMAWGGGGCYGGYARGGCYGMGMGMGRGGMGGGGGYGGMAWGGVSPWVGGYAYSPMIYNYGTPVLAGNTTMLNPGTQSFFYNPNAIERANEATLIVHLPADANLTVDGKPTRSTSGTRTFFSPPLQAGKHYTYTLRAEVNRDGAIRDVEKTVEVQAGRTSNVTLDFGKANRDNETNNSPPANEQIAPATQRRTSPPKANPPRRTLPTLPRDR